MDTRQLKCFLGVAEHLNFTRAAGQLCLTHSAVGYQVASLEEELGTRLFRRDSHSVQLTAAGAYFEVQARRILQEYQEAVEMAKRIAKGVSGRVKVGFLGGPEEKILPMFLKTFRKDCPEVEVQPRHYSLGELQQDFVAGDVDIAFTHTASVREFPGVSFRPFYLEPLGIVVNQEHPRAGAAELELAELKDEAFIQLTGMIASPIRKFEDRMFARAGFARRTVRVAEDFGTLFMLVESGVGITILPRYKVDLIQHPGIRFVPLKDPDWQIEGCVAWKTQTANPVVPILLDALEAFLAQVG